MSNFQLYQEVLTSAAQGTALWEPSTSPSHIAPSIGDVGYLRFGAFIRLFNATLPLGHADNENGVPANYVPLNMHSISVRRGVLPRGVIAAAGVEVGPSQNETVHFKCINRAGAVVMTDAGVQRQDAVDLQPFAEYIAAHAQSWAHFARFQLMHEVAMHELILLTGCDVTDGQYSVTAFNSARVSKNASFQLSHPGSRCSNWSHSPSIGYFQHNYGPPITARPVGQCIFVRGVKVLDRLIDKLEREDEDESWFVENCCTVQPRGALDAVLRYLSDVSHAEVAIVHDIDLVGILGKGHSFFDYHAILKKLRKTRRSFVVRGNAAFLV